MKQKPTIIKDIRRVIDNDEWMWMCVHGPGRTGKSTFCLNVAYQIYGDWDKVLNCFVFNLSQLIYKIKKGIPARWPTRNLLHMRVPLIVWDDFGAHSNKAMIKNDESWNVFKGAFDTLGTKMGVLMANMITPNSPTLQLVEKFTHEVWIPYRGHYKYDKITSGQDYYGFRPQTRKEWIDDSAFDMIPEEVFKQYDEMRMELADETIQRIEDTLVETHMGALVKRIQPMDVSLLKLIKQFGPVHTQQVLRELGDDGKAAIIRMKARQLISPVRVGHKYYKYDLNDLALELLKELAKPKPTLSTHST